MPGKDLPSRLRFYFIVDCDSSLPVAQQVEIALGAGATMVQYRNKHFTPGDFESLAAARRLCRLHQVPFIVNDDIMLALAVSADGVHLGQSDPTHCLAAKILGDYAIIGASVSALQELAATDLPCCDYIGTGPVFYTSTKADADTVIGPGGLAAIVSASPVPVVAIGGIDAGNAGLCFSHGAAGIAVISAITRSADPAGSAAALGAACGVSPRGPATAWSDEFELLGKALSACRSASPSSLMLVSPGDDAALFADIPKPVFTTDTQREDIHFRRCWQSMEAIGKRAVEITFSDLAASYAKPVAFFVNLCLPAEIDEKDVLELFSGIDHALCGHGAALAGGNLSAGSRLCLDLFAAGAGSSLFPKRSAALPGDGLYVTGPVGLARSGLECLVMEDFSFPALIEAFTSPAARFDAADVLLSQGVSCVMDISDGLCGDAAHIAAESGVSVRFETADIDIDPRLQAYCDKYGLDPASQMLSGGDDYELLFACKPWVFEAVRAYLPGACRIGEIAGRGGVLCTGVPEGISSYRHGGAGRDMAGLRKKWFSEKE